jgi:hypothetical protein
MFKLYEETGTLRIDIEKGQAVFTSSYGSGRAEISIHDFTDEQVEQAVIFFTGELARRQEAAQEVLDSE